MNNLRQAAQQALEVLVAMSPSGPTGSAIWHQQMQAIVDLSKALAEPEQEPVPWEQFYPDIGKPQTTHWEGCEAVHPECRKPDTDCHAQGICQRSGYSIAPLQRKPLPDEDIDELSRTMVKGDRSVNWLCRAIERAHGIGEQHE